MKGLTGVGQENESLNGDSVNINRLRKGIECPHGRDLNGLSDSFWRAFPLGNCTVPVSQQCHHSKHEKHSMPLAKVPNRRSKHLAVLVHAFFCALLNLVYADRVILHWMKQKGKNGKRRNTANGQACPTRHPPCQGPWDAAPYIEAASQGGLAPPPAADGMLHGVVRASEGLQQNM